MDENGHFPEGKLVKINNPCSAVHGLSGPVKKFENGLYYIDIGWESPATATHEQLSFSDSPV